MPPMYSPPCLVPSFLTVRRLMPQYRRQTTTAAKRLPLSSRLAVSDFRNDRTGTLVFSHHVGDPMQMRSYSPLTRLVGDADLPGRAAELRRQHPEDVEIGMA